MTIGAPKHKSTDVRVKELHISYEHFPYRAAYEFGGRSADQVTLLDVHCTVASSIEKDKRCKGWAS